MAEIWFHDGTEKKSIFLLNFKPSIPTQVFVVVTCQTRHSFPMLQLVTTAPVSFHDDTLPFFFHGRRRLVGQAATGRSWPRKCWLFETWIGGMIGSCWFLLCNIWKLLSDAVNLVDFHRLQGCQTCSKWMPNPSESHILSVWPGELFVCCRSPALGHFQINMTYIYISYHD